MLQTKLVNYNIKTIKQTNKFFENLIFENKYFLWVIELHLYLT